MRKTSEKYANAKGITLIALIITIVVMLILVAVSIQIALNTGLFESAEKATKSWKAEQEFEQNMVFEIGEIEYGSVEQYIETITKGIENKSIVLTSSEQEVMFENTIKEYNIKNENKEYITYEIMGISLTEDGEYIQTGSIEGKSGNLEIIGDINDTTFKYNLTSFMKGDEVFYCKANVDGKEYLQEIKIIQGDVVRYEEYMIPLRDSKQPSGDNGVWLEIEGDMWSGGKAKRICGDTTTLGHKDYTAYFEFEFQGSAWDLIFGQTEKAQCMFPYMCYNSLGESLGGYFIVLDMSQAGQGVNKTKRVEYDPEGINRVEAWVVGAADYASENGIITLVVDAIDVYR